MIYGVTFQGEALLLRGKIDFMNNREEANDLRITTIALKIKKLRTSAGYTSHEAFAWDNGINRVQYWRIEKGNNITLKTLMQILDIHQITLSEFFKDIN